MHGLLEALQLELADTRELDAVAAPGQQLHGCRDEDAVAWRPRAQPRRLDRGYAEVVPVLDGRLTGAQADPEVHRLLGIAVAALE